MVESVNSSHDYLDFSKDKAIRAEIKEGKLIHFKIILTKETLLFSDKIIKINRYNMSQDRQIVITNKALYNFKKKELKRRINLPLINGISISKLTDEFVVHGNEAEYDYDYVSSKRLAILKILANAYKELTKGDLILCVLDDKSLKNVITLKPEKKKDPNFSRMPTKEHLTFDEYSKSLESKTSDRGSIIIKDVIIINDKNIKDVNLNDFQIISVVGRGTFGKVCLVEYKNTGELYAMKSIKKDMILDTEQLDNIILEKKILQSVNHPFLCKLEFCFQTEDRVYFIMNFVRGGELFQHLKKSKVFDEKRVRFYAAQIGLALEHLHSKGIIYRDLKPENILMDEEGYLQLADFGMAKTLKKNEKALSLCGTPEYIAPEIINSEGHDYMADWWSYGILM